MFTVTELSCDDTCKQVIADVASKFDEPDFNSALTSASLTEAQTFLPDIPQTFWDWLKKHPLIAEAITAVKWPLEPQVGKQEIQTACENYRQANKISAVAFGL